MWMRADIVFAPHTEKGDFPMNSSKNILALVICLFAFISIADASTPVFITIDYPNAVHTFVLGSNPAGDLVGAYDDALGHEHGFVLRNGDFTSFDWPGSTWTNGYGINSSGDIVGQYGWFDGVTYATQGFLLRDGNFYPVDVPGQQNTMPFKISSEGTIVGCNHHNLNNLGGTDLNTMMGFTLDPAGIVSQTMTRSMNNGVNPAGDVVGYYFGTPSGATSTRAEWSYVIRNGVMTWFQFPNAFATLATDIAPTGAIVGRYRASSQTPAVFHGFIVQNGEFESLDVPGATQTLPFGITATGDIVGYYVVGSGITTVYHGFLHSRGQG
jgi:hypothetical protein